MEADSSTQLSWLLSLLCDCKPAISISNFLACPKRPAGLLVQVPANSPPLLPLVQCSSTASPPSPPPLAHPDDCLPLFSAVFHCTPPPLLVLPSSTASPLLQFVQPAARLHLCSPAHLLLSDAAAAHPALFHCLSAAAAASTLTELGDASKTKTTLSDTSSTFCILHICSFGCPSCHCLPIKAPCQQS
ncbi:hypothetical protein Nepgr_029497 [Nepenthes gracilis]|uniref:Uncharacterized protein n=1 Tax=Nepenthes gracilis TaxID=150966 RepID=A0AAD3TE89_NEPGR|nr:hypothetical protein Nepgr_029497 [Nepenthes gracilis]